jgi:hypothetical protein
MNRIKTFQIQQNVYRNVGGAERPIAYISLGWQIDKLIPGFISNLIEGLILKEVIDAHGFNTSHEKLYIIFSRNHRSSRSYRKSQPSYRKNGITETNLRLPESAAS